MHPAHELLILLVLILHIALPLAAWIMLTGYRDTPTRLWLTGISLYCAGAIVAAFNTAAYSHAKFLLQALLFIAAFLLMLEALLRDLKKAERSPQVLWMALLVGGIYFSFIAFNGLYQTAGLMSISAMFLAFGLTAMHITRQLIQRDHSRSMWLITLALALMVSGHVLRLTKMAMGASPSQFQVISYTWNSNYLFLTTVITMILISFGYWGYVLDKMGQKNQHMLAQKLAAEMLTQESQALLQEREHLLMVNARVSAISSLSSFSAMLVHDISQPLQALEFGLHDLQSQATPDQTADRLLENIHELQQLSSKAGEMVSHLRQLMGRGQEQVSAIGPDECLTTILPILKGEAKQRGIALNYCAHLPAQPQVMANAVMLQRILFNTVGNALDAFQGLDRKDPTIDIEIHEQMEDQAPGVLLKIMDNGPGFSLEMLSQLDKPIPSSKPHGLGLGLLLMQSMVRMWGGHTRIGNRPSTQGPGGLIQIWLRAEPTENSHKI